MLAVRLFKCLAVGHNVLDTHVSNYYKNPTAKIDVALSGSTWVRPITVSSELSYCDDLPSFFRRFGPCCTLPPRSSQVCTLNLTTPRLSARFVSFYSDLPVDQPDFFFLTAVGALGERGQDPVTPQVHDWPGPGKGRDRSLAIL